MHHKKLVSRGVFAALLWGAMTSACAPVEGDEAATAGAAAVAAPMCMGYAATIVGTAGNDVIFGTPGVDVIVGLGGNDTIYGAGGDDILCGGTGDDFLDGQGGNDRVNGGAGSDVLADQGGGVDTADYSDSPAAVTVRVNNFGGSTADGWGGTDSMDNMENAVGSAFADALHGDDNANQLVGGSGADALQGNGGNDTLVGGAGNDVGAGGAGIDACMTEVTFSCP